MNRLISVGFKHWWHYLNPSLYKKRRILQAFIDTHQEELLKKYEEEYRNLLLYGCSIAPEEFYGKGVVDELERPT